MKKTITSVFPSVSASTSDENDAHDAAKAIYEHISSAKAIVSLVETDIWTASEMSISEAHSLLESGIEHMIESKKYTLNLDKNELIEGAAHMISANLGCDWDALTENEKDTCRKNVDLFGYLFKDNLSHACVSAIITSYKLNGKIEQAYEALHAAKSSINRLCEKNPNYEHSAALKKYYEKTATYFSFLNLPFDDLSCILHRIQMHRATLDKATHPLSTIFGD